MKIVKARVLSIPSLIILVLANVFVSLYIYGKGLSLEIILISYFLINIFLLFIIIPRNNYFLYDDNRLIVRNFFYSFKEKKFNKNDIISIEIKRESFVGIAVKIILKNGKTKIFPTDVSMNELQSMIEDIRENN